MYVSSHCVISGFCEIGEYSLLRVNSTYNDYSIIAKDNRIGSGIFVVKRSEIGNVMLGSPAKPALKSSYDAFDVDAGRNLIWHGLESQGI
ncbi:hypothetical protein GZH53_16875 [Flavihumibacter sp. R14]|nr:hypothetical protein [Flavihumibacter soli]